MKTDTRSARVAAALLLALQAKRVICVLGKEPHIKNRSIATNVIANLPCSRDKPLSYKIYPRAAEHV